jgi:hypothetical protein
MTPEQRRELAALGGKAAHAKGTAHEYTPKEAKEAGPKGGLTKRRAAPPAEAEKPSEPAE